MRIMTKSGNRLNDKVKLDDNFNEMALEYTAVTTLTFKKISEGNKLQISSKCFEIYESFKTSQECETALTSQY